MKKYVLVVDDNKTVAEDTGEKLQSRGYRFLCASTLTEAILHLKTHAIEFLVFDGKFSLDTEAGFRIYDYVRQLGCSGLILDSLDTETLWIDSLIFNDSLTEVLTW